MRNVGRERPIEGRKTDAHPPGLGHDRRNAYRHRRAGLMGAHGYILKHGAEGVGWNRWREIHPEVTPDLSEEKLQRLVLRDANFRGTSLVRSNLEYASLAGADLSGADLTDARVANVDGTFSKLVGATLQRADLGGSDFTGADFRGANLAGAKLTGMHLSHADLSGANLE